jgi:hypothetical protein
LPRSNHEASLLVMQLLFAWVANSSALLRALHAQYLTSDRNGALVAV